ncbi:MAG: TldD/PmbA family protein [Pseudomonadota bacterium]
MADHFDMTDLTDRAAALVEAARKAGADACDAVVSASRSTGVQVRDGKLEDTESSENAAFSLRVFVGDRTASISANRPDDVTALAERAVAMARVSPEDKFAGLAPKDRLTSKIRDLDLFDATEPSLDTMREAALACEQAALDVAGVTKSSGASSGYGLGGTVLVTSDGFAGAFRSSRHSLSVSAVAGDGTDMQRDYDYDSHHHASDLRSPEAIGRLAGERTVEKMNPRQVDSQAVPIILAPRIARGFVGHISGALNGALIARGTSYLKDAMGERILPKGFRVSDDPFIVRGQASRPFDGEGVEGEPYDLVTDGIVQRWVLDSATARELKLETNGRAARSGSGTSPSSTNLRLQPGERSPEDMIAACERAFYVTELIGRGANLVTGDYSRGASGFWIENGERTFPVSEVTIAGNLRDMLMGLEAANDLETGFSSESPTLLIEGMTLAGT